MFRFVERKTRKVWVEKAASYNEAKERILRVLGYKPNTPVTKMPMNTYVIG